MSLNFFLKWKPCPFTQLLNGDKLWHEKLSDSLKDNHSGDLLLHDTLLLWSGIFSFHWVHMTSDLKQGVTNCRISHQTWPLWLVCVILSGSSHHYSYTILVVTQWVSWYQILRTSKTHGCSCLPEVSLAVAPHLSTVPKFQSCQIYPV